MPQRRDPVTGDPLSLTEYVSWRFQAVIRNFWFLGLFTLMTTIVWAVGDKNARDWWNYVASYLAIFVESMVGIAFFGQARRDAVVLRKVDREAENILRDVEEK